MNIGRRTVLAALLGVFATAAAESQPFPADALRKQFLQYGVFQKEIAAVFHENTIARRVAFFIDVPPAVFQALFDDLEYAVDRAVRYAGKKYSIRKVDEYLEAHDGDKTAADIYPLERRPAAGHFVYYIRGEYRSAVTLKGSMVMDVKFQPAQGGTVFEISAYVSVINPFLRKVTDVMMNVGKFRETVHRVVDNSIQDIRQTGFTVARVMWETEWKKNPTPPARR